MSAEIIPFNKPEEPMAAGDRQPLIVAANGWRSPRSVRFNSNAQRALA